MKKTMKRKNMIDRIIEKLGCILPGCFIGLVILIIFCWPILKLCAVIKYLFR